MEGPNIRKKIGILGGTFDPPTVSHLQVASEILNNHEIDEVQVVPCGIREDKAVATSGEHRLEMVRLAIRDMFLPEFPVRVNDIEIQNVITIPTYFLMKRLEKENPHNDYYFIMGTDLVGTVREWHEGDKLLEEVKFIIINRHMLNTPPTSTPFSSFPSPLSYLDGNKQYGPDEKKNRDWPK
eukprot:CAMPEP_0170544452 /NCGR_PEP_ID=MMETSP0211-20121228/3212_1 /TAXON_ID=311385 /ORGANISM="Pseudokeronopsis sp., Strain OXSARD2" /LENGTH=181 /DNA_ID=CAMNT_0010848109 /DNA_START=17 /DNA_END=562 /DNA_ORIENTATION=-